MAKKAASKKTATKKTATKKKSPAKGSGKKLLIVESPAKAKTINKFLGRDFQVKASMGHVRDIPRKGRGKAAFGIDFENNYEPTYEPIKERSKTLNELRKAADNATEVFLAPDPDREGEAIAWHLKEALHLPEDRTRRVTFNSITKRAVQEAVEHPSTINMNLVNAQQGRRVLDRIVGFSLSPFLWKKVTKGLSAGRVQSVAVRIVVEREREIMAFTPQEYWRIMALLSPEAKEDDRFEAHLVEWKGKKFALGEKAASNEENATAVAEALRQAQYAVEDVSEREVKSKAPPPFITSSLQQAASTALRFGTSKTMRIAQQLYEGVEIDGGATGLITYMRTDSFNIAPEAIGEVRGYIERNYAPDYLPEKPNVYGSRKGAQEAHEAIRPTSVLYTPESIKKFLSSDQYRLYDLIWRRFVASQMMPARFRTTTARIRADEGMFEAKGRRVVFDGHTVLGTEYKKAQKKKAETEKAEKDGEKKSDSKTNEDQLLPKMETGDALDLHELTPSQHFTQPPPRYSEASLVRALEKEGIGRPSTYAPIVKTIQDRGYVRLMSRRFHATELGMAVTDILVRCFPEILDLKFTAGMETDLDRVEEGAVNWVKLVDDFYKPFAGKLDDATENAEPLKGQPAPGGETCPECEAPMVVRYSKEGAFLGCSAYPDCKGTRRMPGEDGPTDGEDGEPEEQHQCPACGARLQKKRSRFGVFFGCEKYPECKVTFPASKEEKILVPPAWWRPCPKCGSHTAAKRAGKGGMFKCNNEDCGYVVLLDANGEELPVPDVTGMVCEKCNSKMTVKNSRRGPFLACSGYPKCKNAKPLPKPGEENAEPDGKTEASEKAETSEEG